MSSNEENKPVQGKLLDHNYDGIQELDNPLPGWWLATFYGAIVFSVIYFFYFHMQEGHSIKAEFQKEMAEVNEAKTKSSAGGGGDSANDAALLAAAIADPAKAQLGHGVYTLRCTPCHGQAGEGGIGPNLTDKYWINSDGSPAMIAKTVREGVVAKGMPPWGQVITPEELINVTAFVHSLKGTTPANGKAPQGNLIETP